MPLWSVFCEDDTVSFIQLHSLVSVIMCYYSRHCNTVQIWLWWRQCSFSVHERYSAINAISCVEEKNITNAEDHNKEIILFNLSEYRHRRPWADSGNEEKVEIGGKNSTKKCGEDKSVFFVEVFPGRFYFSSSSFPLSYSGSPRMTEYRLILANSADDLVGWVSGDVPRGFPGKCDRLFGKHCQVFLSELLTLTLTKELGSVDTSSMISTQVHCRRTYIQMFFIFAIFISWRRFRTWDWFITWFRLLWSSTRVCASQELQ